MAELLLELFSEEIPARMQAPMAGQLQSALESKLKDEELFVQKVETYVTPRRLVVHADGLSLTQEDKIVEKKGPRVGASEQAVEGFLKSTGLNKDQLTVRETPKGEFYFAVQEQKGRPTKDVLRGVLEEVVGNLTWPKSMRWGDSEMRWVRPLHNICCIFGGDVLELNFGHLSANNTSFGHRFLGPESFTVSDFAQYKENLANQNVILEAQERKRIIWEQATKLAESKGLTIHEDEGLLNEVAGLVEWPEVLLGTIDDDLMQVPEEVLISSIRTHQKYFVLRDSKGKLAPHFLVASNMQTGDGGAAVVAGNERVLRARLSDAQFFWDQDRNVPLEARQDALKRVVFHAKLGTVAHKVKRITGLAKLSDVWIPHAHFNDTERAAELCKADLVTEMVGEFPDLQGTMGYYYALEQKEKKEVALAIKEHYAPLGPEDEAPTNPVSVAIALADKVDTLVGMFTIDEKPTGSKDPYALRRAALGVIRIILENRLEIPLRVLFANAIKGYTKSLFKAEKKAKHKVTPEEVTEELLAFFIDRLKVLLKGEGVRHDLITAVFGDGEEDDILRLCRRVAALDDFLNTDNGANLLAAYKRAANILRIEEKKDKANYTGKTHKGLLEQKEEEKLFAILCDMKPTLKSMLKEDKFKEAMEVLVTLRGPVDDFFDKVTVNDENKDLRENRLLLLAQMRRLFDGIANFDLIEG